MHDKSAERVSLRASFELHDRQPPSRDRNLESALTRAIAARPRISMATLPTPLQEAPRLSERLGVRVLIKRDDQTGLATGGNKARKLEFLAADALSQGADVMVTTGGSQSNHARIAAAACRLAGLDCHLVLDRGVHPQDQGNLLLDYLLGARVELIESLDPAVAVSEMERVAASLRAAGRHPYIVPRGGSVPAGATGYVAFVPELLDQLETASISPTSLVVASGSAGTHGGILAGLAALGVNLPVQGISVNRDSEEQRSKVLGLANATLEYLDLPVRVSEDRVLVDDRFRGPGYGIPTEETMAAISLAALDEGIVLDPVYTGKAMAGLVALAREGGFGADDLVVFVHTGGQAGLFAYHQEVMEMVHRLQTTGV